MRWRKVWKLPHPGLDFTDRRIRPIDRVDGRAVCCAKTDPFEPPATVPIVVPARCVLSDGVGGFYAWLLPPIVPMDSGQIWFPCAARRMPKSQEISADRLLASLQVSVISLGTRLVQLEGSWGTFARFFVANRAAESIIYPLWLQLLSRGSGVRVPPRLPLRATSAPHAGWMWLIVCGSQTWRSSKVSQDSVVPDSAVASPRKVPQSL